MLRNALLLSLLSLSVLAAPNVVRLEAEKADGLSDQARVLEREGASGGACLQLGVRGARNDAPGGRKADATVSAKVPWRGNTVIWGRVLAPNGGADSLHLADADGSFHTLSLKSGKDWQWTVLQRTRPDAEGMVALRLQYRELGVLMDEIVLVSGRDLLPDAEGRFRRKDVKNPYAEPPFLPPKEHPRVFLRRQDIPALRAKLTGPEGEALRADLEKLADRPGDGVLPKPTDKEKGNFNRGIVGDTILANAYLGLLDGDDARRKRAVEMFTNYFRTVEFPDRHDATRDYGEVLMTGGLIYDWCYDLLTPEWKEQFVEDALELASRTEIGYPPVRQGAITSHAGEAQLMRDQFAVAVAVYDEFPEWYRIGAGRFFQDFVPARDFFFPSHRHHQGDSYGPYRFQWSMFATWLFDRMGADPVFTAEQGKVPYSWLYMRRPDGQLIRDGDTFLSGQYWQFPLAMMLTASYYHDPYLEYEYRRQIAVSGRNVPALWRALFHDPKLEPKAPLDLPLTKFFPEPLGGMVARTGWRQGVWSRAVVCEMKGAGYHFNNHHHLDAGGFQIYYRGGLATDAGCYGHYGIPYDWHWNKRSIAHNTLLLYDPANVDATKHDGGQNYPNRRREPGTLQILKEKGYKDGSVLAHAFGPDAQRPFFSYIKTDLTPGYADRAEKVERSCVFLNLAGEDQAGLLVVLDRMVAKDAKLRPVWLLHGVQEPGISGSRATFLRTDGNYAGRLVSDTLLPRDAKITPIGGSTAEGKAFDTVFEADKPTTESGGWRIEVSPREPTESTLFLHALQIGDADGGKAVAAQRVETDQLLGARVGNELVLMAKNGELLTGSMTLAISGDAPVRVVVADLAAGFWSAVQNGKASHQFEATADGHAICLRLAPGTYRLTRSAERSLPEVAKDGLVPPSVDATVPEVIDGNRPLALSGVVRETGDGPLVALRPVAEALGAQVSQDANGYVAAVGQARTTLSSKAREAQSGGQEIVLARVPVEDDGQLWVGLDALGLALRRPCRWDPASSVVIADRLADGQLFVQKTTASHTDKPGSEKWAIDRNPQTYWAAKEDGAWLQVDLGVSAEVRSVGIDWLHSDTRRVRYEILASLDGETWQEIFAGKSDGKTPGLERVSVPVTNARFLRIVGHGNDKNPWNSIRELTVWTK
jgi:heparin/heparan-sulfate lyase